MTDFGIGNRIKQRKLELDLTVEEISARTSSKVPAATINNIIYSKTTNPQIDVVVELAAALELSLDELVLGKRAMKAEEMTIALDTYIKTANESREREVEALHKACNASLAAKDARLETKDLEISLVKESHQKEIAALMHAHKITKRFMLALIIVLFAAAAAFAALYFRYLLWDMSNLNEGFIKYMQSNMRGLLG